jgi:hypothetical protein
MISHTRLERTATGRSRSYADGSFLRFAGRQKVLSQSPSSCGPQLIERVRL